MTKFRYVAINGKKISKTEWLNGGNTSIETLNIIKNILNAKYKNWFIEFK